MSSTTEPSPRGRVLTAVEDHLSHTGDAVTSAELADSLALHPSTVRFHLRKLVESGQVTEESGSTGDGRGRPRKRYRPAPRTPTDALLTALVEVLADSDAEREERAAQAGRIWASTVIDPTVPPDSTDPLDAASTVLTSLGFEIQSSGTMLGTCEIRVCSCPLRILGQHHPEVARGIQRGAVEHALASWSDRPDAWTVSSRPDPRFGDCEVTLRFSPAISPLSTS